MARTRVHLSDINKQDDNNAEDIIKKSVQASSDNIIARNLVNGSSKLQVAAVKIEGEDDTDSSEPSEEEKEPVRKNSDPIYNLFDSNKYDIVDDISANNENEEVTRAAHDISSSSYAESRDNANVEHNDEEDDEVITVAPKSGRKSVTEHASENWSDVSDDSSVQNDDKSFINEENGADNLDMNGDSGSDGDNVDIDVSHGRVTSRNISTKPRTIRDDYDASECVPKITNLPLVVMDRLSEQFDLSRYGRKVPGMQTILTAYIFIKEGYPQDFPISQKVSDVVDCYRGGREISNEDLQEKMMGMSEKIDAEFENMRAFLRRDVMRKLTAIEISSLYSIFRAMDFSVNDNMSDPADVDFQERGMSEMQKSLERQVINKLESDKVDNGRDVYNARFKEKR